MSDSLSDQHLAADRHEAAGEEDAQRCRVARRDLAEHQLAGRYGVDGGGEQTSPGATAVPAGGELDRHLDTAKQAVPKSDEATLVAQHPDVVAMVAGALHARMVLEIVTNRERGPR